MLIYSIDNFSQVLKKKEDNKIYSVNGIDVGRPRRLRKVKFSYNENLQKSWISTGNETKLYAVFVVEKMAL
jgi:hypothetical protein